MIAPHARSRARWLVLAVFLLSSTINYLDRQSLATLAPVVSGEFHLSRAEYGGILTAFSIAYAASAPAAGWWIDRAGLNLAITLAVAVWSCAGIATGLTHGLVGLVACRAVLGMAEAAGIPAAAKAIHRYLQPAERALGNALNQAGVSLGLILAPPVATWIAIKSDWRMAFVATGALGLLWIPLWLSTARRQSAIAQEPAPAPLARGLLRDPRLWAIALANALGMIGYSLWTNWTTLYLVDVHHLTLQQAAWYAWIPPVFFIAGGAAGGWLSMRWMRGGMEAVPARFRVCLAAAALSLITAAIPAAPGVLWSVAGISISVLAVSAFSVNMYTLPLDVFGSRAAFAVSMLVSSYGASQAIISPWFGRLIDLHGYAPVTAIAALTPMAACMVLYLAGPVKQP